MRKAVLIGRDHTFRRDVQVVKVLRGRDAEYIVYQRDDGKRGIAREHEYYTLHEAVVECLSGAGGLPGTDEPAK